MEPKRWTLLLALALVGTAVATTGITGAISGQTGDVDRVLGPLAADGDRASAWIDDHAATIDGTHYVWQSREAELTVRIDEEYPNDGAPEEHYEVCVDAHDTDRGESVDPDCEETIERQNVVEDDREFDFDLDLSDVSAQTRLEIRIPVAAVDCDGDDCAAPNRVETLTVPIVVITEDGDLDGDGVENGAELDRGTDPTDPDDPGDSNGEDSTDDPDDSDDDDGTDDPDDSNPGTDTPGSDGESDGTDDGQRGSDSDQQTNDQSDGQSGDRVQRGFFTNDRGSPLFLVSNPMNITTIGFVLSVIGISLELRRGL